MTFANNVITKEKTIMKPFSRCPICSSKLEYRVLKFYEDVYTVKNNGGVYVNKTKREYPEDCVEKGYLKCSNKQCGFKTDEELNVVGTLLKDVNIYKDVVVDSIFFRTDVI